MEENQRKWIMVDCGVTFPTPNFPGVDLVLPDIHFVESLGDALLGVIITHAHEDHYGALLILALQQKKPGNGSEKISVHCRSPVGPVEQGEWI